MTMHRFFPNPSKVYGGNIHYQSVIGHVPNTFRGTPPLQALCTSFILRANSSRFGNIKLMPIKSSRLSRYQGNDQINCSFDFKQEDSHPTKSTPPTWFDIFQLSYRHICRCKYYRVTTRDSATIPSSITGSHVLLPITSHTYHPYLS